MTLKLANRFREVLLNGTWIANTNYKDQLTGLDWEIATTKIENLNTIAALAQHIHYYIAGVSSVLKGGDLTIKDAYSFNFPPITSQLEWQLFLNKFWEESEQFALLIEQMPKDKLDNKFVKEAYGSYHRNIIGIIEHCYYHLGQIVLIKRMIKNKKS